MRIPGAAQFMGYVRDDASTPWIKTDKAPDFHGGDTVSLRFEMTSDGWTAMVHLPGGTEYLTCEEVDDFEDAMRTIEEWARDVGVCPDCLTVEAIVTWLIEPDIGQFVGMTVCPRDECRWTT